VELLADDMEKHVIVSVILAPADHALNRLSAELAVNLLTADHAVNLLTAGHTHERSDRKRDKHRRHDEQEKSIGECNAGDLFSR